MLDDKQIGQIAEKVKAAWGNPDEVSKAVLDALFDCSLRCDHVTRVEFARKIGVLSGLMVNSTPEEFMERLGQEVLKDIQVSGFLL
ncbi:MAG: hypothetical protein WC270_05800 [Patescibacteria group bacterium]|jgi:hypothetical protein